MRTSVAGSLVTVVLVSLLFPPASVRAQRRYYVDTSVKNPGNGTSWSTAFRSLQTALLLAKSPDEIWVAKGTYTGGFTMPSGVTLLGGFTSGDSRATQRSPFLNRTVLDGGSKQRVLALGDGNLIDGFIVQNGRAGGDGGGGALINGTNPKIRNCLFTKNTNTAGRGSTLHIIKGASPTIENSFFVGNAGSGHVIDIEQSGGLYLNIVVFDNKSNGLHFQKAATPRIYNSIFAMNTGRGVCDITSDDRPILENNLFWKNGISAFHYRGRELTVSGLNALSYAKNNISADPRFRDATKGDYRLTSTSPCIDKGHPTLRGPTTDYFGNSRLNDGNLDRAMVTDMGAHEYSNVTLAITGTPMPGSPLKFTASGNSQLFALLGVGTSATSGLAIDPLGYLFLNLATPVAILPWAPLPANVTITIPKNIKSGTRFVFQSFALTTKGTGNTSNLVDLTIR